MVYQEDVMKLSRHYGGLDLGDANVLRRMMRGKTRNKEKLSEIKDKFLIIAGRQATQRRLQKKSGGSWKVLLTIPLTRRIAHPLL